MTTLRATRLHAALDADGILDLAMLSQAVDAGIREDEQLDWKRVLRLDDERELAKDIAAMANTRGGLLIYGVAQDNATSAASKIIPIDIGDRVVTRFHQAVHRQITPIVEELQVVPISEPGGPTTEGVLAVLVPDSPNAPHLVGDRTNFGVPYRTGPSTSWMTEHQIQRAYQVRADRTAAGEIRLEQLMDQTAAHLNPRFGWLIGGVRPVQPSEAPASLDKHVATNTAALAIRIGARMIVGIRGPFGPRRPLVVVDQFSSTLLNPRPGLRRWVFQDRGRDGAENRDVFLHVELHDDGSLTFATTSGDSSQDPDAEPFVWTDETKIVGFSVDLVAIAYAHATSRVVDGRMRARIMLKKFDDRPFALAAHERAGSLRINHLSRPGWTRELTDFEAFSFDLQPLDALASDPEHPLPAIADRLSADIANQFGFIPFTLGGG